LRKTLNIWWVIVFVACVLAAFFMYSNKLADEIDAMQDILEEEKVKLTEMHAANTELENELKSAGTEAFIENQARDQYGFMMPDEIRFVISNPHAQNDDGAEIPSP